MKRIEQFALAAGKLALIALAFASHGAQAVTTWNSGSCSWSAGSNAAGQVQGTYVGNHCAVGSGATGVDVTAWGTTGTVGSGLNIQAGSLAVYSGGWSVTNNASNDTAEGSAPEHATDNEQQIDGLLFSFGQSTILKSLAIGWSSTDTDLTVLRYTGGSAPSLAGKNISGLVAAGWSVVGNYADMGAGGSINASNAASSWWLITAYSSAFGTGTGLTNGNDYFKLLSVSGDAAKTPEPAGIALVGLAALGAYAARRRKQA